MERPAAAARNGTRTARKSWYRSFSVSFFVLLDRRSVHRRNIWQVLRDACPALALVATCPDIAVRGPEIEAHRVEPVVVHSLTQRFHRRALRQALLELFPGLALVARAIDADP